MHHHVDNPFQSPVTLNFCPGLLGLERGLASIGITPRVMAYVEIEAFINANLVAGMEAGILDPAPIWTDATTFDARPFRGKIHAIIGGYPCPGESLAGLREKHLYKGFIWPSIRKAVHAGRPLWCFFENVDDHLTGTYPIVLRSLRNMGYTVEAGIYTAEEAGAPHERARLFILAVDHTACKRLYGSRYLPEGWISYYPDTGQKLGNSCNVTRWQDPEGGLGVDRELLSETGRYQSADGTGAAGNTSAEQLANSQSKRCRKEGCCQCHETNRVAGGSATELANADSTPAVRVTGNISGSCCTNESKACRKDGQWCRHEPEYCNQNVADALCSNAQGIWTQRVQIPEACTGATIPGCSCEGMHRWPAGQGSFQYEWEHPRIIKSGMGSTINGYNFREDLLRALGNSVVEQTAAIAFIDLINKHRLCVQKS